MLTKRSAILDPSSSTWAPFYSQPSIAPSVSYGLPKSIRVKSSPRTYIPISVLLPKF